MRRIFPTAMAFVVIHAACASKAYDPFVMEPAELSSRIQGVAVPAVAVSDDLPVPDSTLSALEFAIALGLEEAGFSVVGPEVVSSIWVPILDDVGGFYDPRNGRIIEEKRREATQRFARELRERYNVDAIAYAELIVVDAPYADGNATWDGASQSVASFWDKLFETVGAVADAMDGTPHVSSLPVGTVPAVTLQIVLEDLDGQELYANWGGVEVIADDETGEWLEPDKTFKDFERFNRAVQIVLEDLVEQVGPSARTKKTTSGKE